MCRHIAWLGPPRALDDLILRPEFGLLRQSWAPRRQRHGTMNADGFGAAWYVDGRETPVRFRRAQPMWTDASFASIAPTIDSGCVLAAVRSATVGTAADESCAAPFVDGTSALSHNGALRDWPGDRARFASAVAAVPEAAAGVDSALPFGLAATAWRAGVDLTGGLASAVRELEDGADDAGRLTLLATDGRAIAGVVVGEPMYVTRRDGGVLVASEPDDDGETWEQIPDRHLITVTRDGDEFTVTIDPLDQPSPPATTGEPPWPTAR